MITLGLYHYVSLEKFIFSTSKLIHILITEIMNFDFKGFSKNYHFYLASLYFESF